MPNEPDPPATAAITVAVRVRPFFEAAADVSSGTESGLKRIVNVVDERVLVFDPEDPNGKNRRRTYAHGSRRHKEIRYGFDRVFNESASQQHVYEGTAKPLIDGLLNGYNATVFAYGATGCGKTHTITGTPKDPGIIFLTMQDLFSRIQNASSENVIESSVSYLEVYNETIRDLLSSAPANQSLDVREDDNNTRVVVAGLSEHTPRHVDDVMRMLIKGNENRTRAPTEANAVSSRSHAVLQIHIRIKDRAAGVHSNVKMATLSIIDLAGSERASVTKNKGERLLEGANINRSLLALGNCINALCSDRPSHIPYRDSKLTRLLKYSLGGNCRVVMIANISPSSFHYDETHNTLKYANRAKNIKTKVEQNTIDVAAHMAQYPMIINELKAEVHLLREQLARKETKESSLEMAGEEAGIAEGAFDMLARKVKRIFEKIEGKELERCEALAEVDKNERRGATLRAAYAVLKQSDGDGEEARPHLDAYCQAISAAVEEMDIANVGLRHNANLAERTIARHNAEVHKIQHGSIGKKLSEEQRERLGVEVQLMKLGAQNALLVRQLETHQTALAEQSHAYQEAVSRNANDLRGLTNIIHIAREHDLIGEEVVALVEGVLEGSAGTLQALTQKDRADMVEVNYDTCSETSDSSDMSDNDDSASESEYAESDGEEVARPRGRRRNSFLGEEMESMAKLFTAPSLAQKVAETPARKRQEPATPATAIKVRPIKPIIIEGEDIEATPHAHKRRASPQMDVTNKKSRSAPTDDEKMGSQSESDAAAPTPTRGRLRLGSEYDDDATPLAKPRQSSSNATLFGPPPPAPNFVGNNGDEGADQSMQMDVDEASNIGSMHTSPVRRSRRREARQSLIPVMRGGRRDSMLPMPSGITGPETSAESGDAGLLAALGGQAKMQIDTLPPKLPNSQSAGAKMSETSNNTKRTTQAKPFNRRRQTTLGLPRTEEEPEPETKENEPTRRITRSQARMSLATPKPVDDIVSGSKKRRPSVLPPSTIQTRSSARRKALQERSGSGSPSSGEDGGKPKWK